MLDPPELLVKNNYWTLFLCLIGTLTLAALAAVDMPDTAFNEMDTPVTLSLTALPRGSQRIPAVQARTLQLAWRLDPEEKRPSSFEPGAQIHRSPDLQPLLCTFLI